MNFTHFQEDFLQQGFFFVTGLMGLIMQTLTKQGWTEVAWRNNVYNAKFKRKNMFRTCTSHRMNVFPMVITVCTLLSVLQLIKRFKLPVVNIRKLTLFSWGNID